MGETAPHPIAGHDLKIPEVPIIADAAHVEEAEALNRLVRIGVSGSVIPTGHRIRRKLHRAERRRCTGKGLSESVDDLVASQSRLWIRHRSDHRID